MMQMTFDELSKIKRQAVNRVEANAQPAWIREAEAAVMRLAKKGGEFTTDDVWARIRSTETHEPRAMGAVMRWALASGLIEKVAGKYEESKRAACHRRPLQVWVGVRR